MRAIRYLLSLLPVIFLTACSHSTPTVQYTPGCSTDPYLAKYNCSLSQVQTAAQSGDPDAQYALGYMYYYGINTPRDLDGAKVWIARAASQGQPLAKQAILVITSAQSEAMTIPVKNLLPNYGTVSPKSTPVISALQRGSSS